MPLLGHHVCIGLTCFIPFLQQVHRQHAQLSHQLLRVQRAIDAMEGRYAAAAGYSEKQGQQVAAQLAQQLTELESQVGAQSAGTPC
jgi:sirohydrochlorin ferrochelatase